MEKRCDGYRKTIGGILYIIASYPSLLLTTQRIASRNLSKNKHFINSGKLTLAVKNQ